MYARFVSGMPGFLRQRITPSDARAIVAARLESRERNFLDLLERAVFARSESPYRFLLRDAGCELGDVRQMVDAEGLDGALSRLYDAGLRVSYDEFKGRAPITRAGRTLELTADSFDNPLARFHLEGETSGSTGTPTTVRADLAHITAMTPMLIVAHEATGVLGAPVILYRPVLPCIVATNNILTYIIAGNPVRRWFSPVASAEIRSPLRFRVADAITPSLVRLCGSPFPQLEVVPFTDAFKVARAAASLVRSDGRCLVRCTASTALTVSIAAVEHGVDLTGVAFTGTGEPLSPAKVRGISASGARHITTYAMHEVGRVGAGCAHGLDATDLHFMRDRLAVVQRPVEVPGGDDPVGVFFLSTLLSTAPKVLINVGTDDFGILEERTCGCLLGELGLHQHLRQIRSVGKLTGRGITLVASDILHLIEEVLPRRYGGTAQDYQLVEEEDSTGATQLHLLVSPSVRLDDEEAPARTLLEGLSRGSPGASLQSAILRGAGAVRVKRQKPRASPRGKLPAFRTVASR